MHFYEIISHKRLNMSVTLFPHNMFVIEAIVLKSLK